MERSKNEALVGIFVLAGILAVAILVFQIGNPRGLVGNNDSYRLYAKFDNIGSLNVKAPVSVAGVNVGRVSGIRIDNNFSAVVELSIASKFQGFPLDTGASILTSGLLGAQYVSLVPGGDDETLTDGDQIELTQSAFILENMLGQLLFNATTGGE